MMSEMPILNLWKQPSFEPNVSWMVYSRQNNADKHQNLFVRELTGFLPDQWPIALNRIEKGEWPDDIVRTASISPADFQQHIQGLWDLSVPLNVKDSPIGYDGISYGLELFAEGNTAIKLTWWSEGPESWKRIADWHNNTIDYLVDVLDSRVEAGR